MFLDDVRLETLETFTSTSESIEILAESESRVVRSDVLVFRRVEA